MKSTVRSALAKFNNVNKLINAAEKTNEKDKDAITSLNNSFGSIRTNSTNCAVDPNDLNSSLQEIQRSSDNIRKLTKQVLRESISFLKIIDTPEQMSHLSALVARGGLGSITSPSATVVTMLDNIIANSITTKEADLQSLITNQLNKWNTTGDPSIDSLSTDAKTEAEKKRDDLQNALHSKIRSALGEITTTLDSIKVSIQGIDTDPKSAASNLQNISLDFNKVRSLKNEFKDGIKELEKFLKDSKSKGREKAVERVIKDLATELNTKDFTLNLNGNYEDHSLQARSSGYKLQIAYPRVAVEETGRARTREVEAYDKSVGVDLEDFAKSNNAISDLSDVLKDLKNATIKVRNVRELRSFISTLQGLN